MFPRSFEWLLTNFPALELSQLARKVLSLPASVSACDQFFSLQGRTHTTDHNRLANDTVDKLMFVKSTYKLLKK